MRLKETKWIAQDLATSQWQRWNVNPGGPDSRGHACSYRAAGSAPVFTPVPFAIMFALAMQRLEFSEFLFITPPFPFWSLLVRGHCFIDQMSDGDQKSPGIDQAYLETGSPGLSSLRHISPHYVFTTVFNMTVTHTCWYNNVYRWGIKCLVFP